MAVRPGTFAAQATARGVEIESLEGDLEGDLSSLPGVDHVDELDRQTVLALWPERIPSFADAAVAAVAKRHRLAVATFDRGFVKGLRREGIEIADL